MSDRHNVVCPWGGWSSVKLLGLGTYGEVHLFKREQYGSMYYCAVKHISIPTHQDQMDASFAEGLAKDGIAMEAYCDRLLESFVKEININVSLKGHTNFVSYDDHQIFPYSDGPGYDIYIKMEYLTNLNSHLEQQPLKLADVLRLGDDICSAITVLEKKGLVFGDIKPGNIFVNKAGSFKLGDFGTVKPTRASQPAASGNSDLTFKSPELAKEGKGDNRADIYALGLILYYLLNGNRAPFLLPPPMAVAPSAFSIAQDMRMNGEKMPPPAFADEKLSAIILKACAFDANQRWKDAAQMKEKLANYSRSLSIEEKQATVLDLSAKSYEPVQAEPEITAIRNTSNIAGKSDVAEATSKKSDIVDATATNATATNAAAANAAAANAAAANVAVANAAAANAAVANTAAANAAAANAAVANAAAVAVAAAAVTAGTGADSTGSDSTDAEGFYAGDDDGMAADSSDFYDDKLVPVLKFELPSEFKQKIRTYATHTRRILPIAIAFCALVFLAGALMPLIQTNSTVNPKVAKVAYKFHDPVIEFTVRLQLQKQIGDIYQEDLDSITELRVEAGTVTSIQDLFSMPELVILDLRNQKSIDHEQLGRLTTLDMLNLSGCGLTDASFIENLTALTQLDISENSLTDIGFASKLVNITDLIIRNNAITDLSPLKNQTELKILDADINPVDDWSPVAHIAFVIGRIDLPEPPTPLIEDEIVEDEPIEDVIIAVEKVTVDRSGISIAIGSSVKLTAVVHPADATDQGLTWSSSNASVATVDANGNVTAVSSGTVSVTVACGGKEAKCNVTVQPDNVDASAIAVTQVELTPSNLTLSPNGSAKLTATVYPSDATDQYLRWSSSSSSVATVDASGNVTAVGPGTATITVTCGGRRASCSVTVPSSLAVEKVTLNYTSVLLDESGGVKLTATVSPPDATDQNLSWSSSSSSVAKVDANGFVTAVGAGTATITVTCGGKTASCVITVN